MTSLHLLDDDDGMTMEIERERYVYLGRFVSRCLRKGVLVRWMYRHTVIGACKLCSFSDISNDGSSMTGGMDARSGSSSLAPRRSF